MDNILDNILKIENEIQSILASKNGVTCHFRKDSSSLSLITYNPSHKQFFLLKTIMGGKISSIETELKLYIDLLDYIKKLTNYIESDKTNTSLGYSYTVLWNKSDGIENTSYFYAKNPQEVLDKFYYGKETIKHLFNILEIKQNPIA